MKILPLVATSESRFARGVDFAILNRRGVTFRVSRFGVQCRSKRAAFRSEISGGTFARKQNSESIFSKFYI